MIGPRDLLPRRALAKLSPIALDEAFGRARQALASNWDRAAVLTLVGLIPVIFITFHNYGVSFDEDVQDEYGRYILDWYRTFGAKRDAVNFLDLYFYGGLFDTLAALSQYVLPFGHWANRHLLNAFAGLIGLWGCWRLGRTLGGPAAGFIALATLVLWPSWYGMMFINPKDIPMGGAAVWSVYFTTRLLQTLPKPPVSVVLGLGFAIGCALATRVGGGVLLFGYLGLALAAHVLLHRGSWRSRFVISARITLRMVLPALAIALALMFIFWPYAQSNPIAHVGESYRHFARLSMDIDTLFFGRQVGSAYKPIMYLPVYVFIKAPDFLIAVFCVAATLAVAGWLRGTEKVRMRLVHLPLALSLVVPFIYVFVERPELYDAERHFLFLLPSLSVLTGLVVVGLWRRAETVARGLLIAASVAGASAQVVAMVDLHPYEYSFFNSLVGGLSGSEGQFENEYWGTAISEATSEFGRIVKERFGADDVSVSICGKDSGLQERLPANVRIEEEWENADFFIAMTRRNCDHEMPGKILLTIGRDGVPFAVVKDLRTDVRQVPFQDY